MANKISTNLKKPVLRVGNRFTLNGWMIFDGIALIVIVGVLAVRFAGASVDATFNRNPSQLSGGTLSRSVAAGAYRHVVAKGVHAEASANVTSVEITASTQVCSDVHVNSANTFVDIQLNGHFANKFVENPGNVTICADLEGDNRGGVIYAGTSGDVNILNIYGTK